MKFSANWLNEYLKKSLAPEKMVELLTMHAFEVESCEKFGQDSVLDIKILSNRAHDCMSHIGIARELAAISGVGFIGPKVKLSEDKKFKAKDFISVEVQVPDLCPRYSMRVLTDIKVAPSPKWFQERLQACGLRPISNIVDITNYVMLETGQPLHAFDVDKVAPRAIAVLGIVSLREISQRETSSQTPRNDTVGKIIVRRANEGEKITTLEGKSYNLSPQNLVIADEKVAIGIAGIKGGEGPEIDEKTKIVAIESANFEPTNIRRTRKAFNLKTDASTRFENGLDPELTIEALERALSLMVEFAGGKVASGVIDVCEKKTKLRKVLMDVAWAQGLLGVDIKDEKMTEVLKELGILSKIIKKDGKLFIEASIPTSRLDLQAQEDLAEEVVRLVGYDKIPIDTPRGILIPALREESLIYEDKIKDILVGAGWNEVYNYSFISESDRKIFDFSNHIEIKNPFSQDQKYLRPTLIVNLLKNVRENIKFFDNIRLFEIGHVFRREAGERFEENKIGAVVCHKNAKPTENLLELKGGLEILFSKLGIGDIWFDDAIAQKQWWLEFLHQSRVAEIKSGDELVGWIGEIKQDILSSCEIKEKVAAFELDFAKVMRLASEERMYMPPSKYPAIMRDLAVLVDNDTKTESVLNVIETAGGQLLQDTDLFDIYEGVADNKKSFAFRLTFQSDERNLTDKEVNELMTGIIKAVEEKGWGIRR
ncbi:MAG: phenylalanine--tRNA ligase subunit beta [bacterium]